MNRRDPVRLYALASLALIGLACGRVEIDPLVAVDGQGGAPSIGGHSGTGIGGSSSVGGKNGAGGAAGIGGAAGVGGAMGVGGATGAYPCNLIGDEMTCIARGCRADYCPTCGGSRFDRCAYPGDPMPACGPVPPCPPPLPCAAFTSLAQCQALSYCHAVFGTSPPPNTCTNPLACVAFTGCADGGLTVCSPMPQPRCGAAAPSCAPGYIASLANGACYEGCVLPSECTPIP